MRNKPYTPFSVVVARHGYTTVALGPFPSRDLADMDAADLRTHLRSEPGAEVDVEPYDDTLTHLPPVPTDPRPLAKLVAEEPPAGSDHLPLYARLVAQTGPQRVKRILANAHSQLAAELWNA
jgi:hypothetical protein